MSFLAKEIGQYGFYVVAIIVTYQVIVHSNLIIYGKILLQACLDTKQTIFSFKLHP